MRLAAMQQEWWMIDVLIQLALFMMYTRCHSRQTVGRHQQTANRESSAPVWGCDSVDHMGAVMSTSMWTLMWKPEAEKAEPEDGFAGNTHKWNSIWIVIFEGLAIACSVWLIRRCEWLGWCQLLAFWSWNKKRRGIDKMSKKMFSSLLTIFLHSFRMLNSKLGWLLSLPNLMMIQHV